MTRKTNIFFLAAKNGDLQTLIKCLEQNVYVDIKDDEGRTALHLVTLYNNTRCIAPLIKAGANVEETLWGLTPLHLACMTGYHEAIDALIENGANIFALARDEMNAMHIAIQFKHAHCIKRLKNAGLDINAKYIDGYTSLHLAALKANKTAIRILVKNGADLTLRNNQNNLPVQIAAAMGFAHIVKLFADLGDENAKKYILETEQALVPPTEGLTYWFTKISNKIDELIPLRAKKAGYLLAQIGISAGIIYALDVSTYVLAATTAGYATYSLYQRKRIAEISRTLSPMPETIPSRQKMIAKYVSDFATQLEIPPVEIIYDGSAVLNQNAAASTLTNVLFVSSSLAQKYPSLELTKALIAHEMQHLKNYDNWVNSSLDSAHSILNNTNLMVMNTAMYGRILQSVSPYGIPVIDTLFPLSSLSTFSFASSGFVFTALSNFILSKNKRDEETSADLGAVEMTGNASMADFLYNKFLCLNALESYPHLPENSLVAQQDFELERAWDRKNPIGLFFGAFKQTHPPLVDRIQIIREAAEKRHAIKVEARPMPQRRSQRTSRKPSFYTF